MSQLECPSCKLRIAALGAPSNCPGCRIRSGTWVDLVPAEARRPAGVKPVPEAAG
jgi:hypothetical protein